MAPKKEDMGAVPLNFSLFGAQPIVNIMIINELVGIATQIVRVS